MDFELTEEQLEKVIDILFEEDIDYLSRIKEDLTEEEFKSFLKECPEVFDDL